MRASIHQISTSLCEVFHKPVVLSPANLLRLVDKLCTAHKGDENDSTQTVLLSIVCSMSDFSLSLPISSTNSTAQDDALMSAAKTLIAAMRPADKARLIEELHKQLKPISAPRAGDVLGVIIKLLPQQQSWTISDIKENVQSSGIEASSKEIYNAVGYLNRKKHVRRVGYGRYVVDGIAFTTADDLGGQPAIAEGDHDD